MRTPLAEDALMALELARVLDAMAEYANSAPSASRVLGLRPLGSRDEITRRQAAVEDIRSLMDTSTRAGGASPLGLRRFEDISGVLRSVMHEGSVPEPVDLLPLVSALEIMGAVAALALPGREALRGLTSDIHGFPDLLDQLARTLDGEGGVLDTASHELMRLRRERRALERRISGRLEQMTQEEETARFLQDTFVTRRSGRWVIPVRMDAKGQVRGVVHDVSRTGETAFVEPLEIIGLSNELENLEAEEKGEVIRILRRLGARVRASSDDMAREFEALVALDAHHAIAAMSRRFGYEPPEINESGRLRVVMGHHPALLMMAEGGGGGPVVPLDLELGPEATVMAITGPNAGGKTIAIKTVGLLAAMALMGLPVPADGASSFPMLRSILADIGDEQSVEGNLSTFSAHISRIARIIGESGTGTLVLMDELGTGTDPEQGAAIGSAILQTLRGRGALVLATTHLTDIVGYVHGAEGMVNASMQFDLRTMRPLYRLRPGEPGLSHALDTARNFGLPEETLRLAESLMGGTGREFQALLSELDSLKAEYAQRIERAEGRERELALAEDRMRAEREALDRQKREAVARALEEAGRLVAELKREAYKALDEHRKSSPKQAIKRLSEVQRRVEAELEAVSTPMGGGDAVDVSALAPGARVLVRSIGKEARVVSVGQDGGRVRVALGGKEVEMPPSGLAALVAAVRPEGAGGGPVRGPEAEAALEVRLLGMRVEEALGVLEQYLNEAALAGIREAKVIHGLGTGALRAAVREYLHNHPLVSGIRRAEQFEGGAGVTFVLMR